MFIVGDMNFFTLHRARIHVVQSSLLCFQSASGNKI